MAAPSTPDGMRMRRTGDFGGVSATAEICSTRPPPPLPSASGGLHVCPFAGASQSAPVPGLRRPWHTVMCTESLESCVLRALRRGHTVRRASPSGAEGPPRVQCLRNAGNWGELGGVEPPLSLQPRLPHGLPCVIGSQVRACGQWPACIVPVFPSLPPWLGSGLWDQGFIAWGPFAA